eukprot:gnl/TRDRNA2_/TRDRNA2_173391_c1_seq2.p1 gnl/TRDRNA2_/TRDRNA2_173391_c1~~gnl/TRDRNA2_/TRDRNA2_173391_c1_seq2.p1  ORF type:complete len:1320 (+),score=213.93 gnl/TRDRNA2_/TRDRNA2_173391_c1_seq2:304-3960(+)
MATELQQQLHVLATVPSILRCKKATGGRGSSQAAAAWPPDVVGPAPPPPPPPKRPPPVPNEPRRKPTMRRLCACLCSSNADSDANKETGESDAGGSLPASPQQLQHTELFDACNHDRCDEDRFRVASAASIAPPEARSCRLDEDMILQLLTKGPESCGVQLQCWDFGGQPEYRTLAPLFAAKSCVVVACFNLLDFTGSASIKSFSSRTVLAEEALVAWLGAVHAAAPLASVILVGTHQDKIPEGAEGLELVCRHVQSMLEQVAFRVPEASTKWHRNKDGWWFFPASSLSRNGLGLAVLRKAVEEAALNTLDSSASKEPVPVSHARALDAIRLAGATGSTDSSAQPAWLMSAEELWKLSKASGAPARPLTETTERDAFLGYIETSGLAVPRIPMKEEPDVDQQMVIHPDRMACALAQLLACHRRNSEGTLDVEIDRGGSFWTTLAEGVISAEVIEGLLPGMCENDHRLVVETLLRLDLITRRPGDSGCYLAPFLFTCFAPHEDVACVVPSKSDRIDELWSRLLVQINWPSMCSAFVVRFICRACNRHGGSILKWERQQLLLNLAGSTWAVELLSDQTLSFRAVGSADVPPCDDAFLTLDALVCETLTMWMPQYIDKCVWGPACPLCTQAHNCHPLTRKELQDQSTASCSRSGQLVPEERLPCWISAWRGKFSAIDNAFKSLGERLLKVAGTSSQQDYAEHGQFLPEIFDRWFPTRDSSAGGNGLRTTSKYHGTLGVRRQRVLSESDARECLRIYGAEAHRQVLAENAPVRRRSVKVVFCGGHGTGKTALLNALVADDSTEQKPPAGPTHGLVRTCVETAGGSDGCWRRVQPESARSELHLGVSTAVASRLLELRAAEALIKEVGLDHQLTDSELNKWNEMVGADISTYMKAHPERFLRRVRRGIPSKYRWHVWKVAVKLSDLKLPTDYHGLSRRKNRWTQSIEVDIGRTFPELGSFDELRQQSLLRVLNAYAGYNPGVGYCQGMNFVAGLLLVLSDSKEEESFGVFVCLMDNLGVSGFYRERFPKLCRYLHACDRLVAQSLPELHKHFAQENVQPAMYLHGWFMTLFVTSFPISMVVIIWDVIVCEGLPAVLKVAVSILQVLKHSLLSMQFEEIIKFFKMMRSYDERDGELSSFRIAKLLMKHTDSVEIPASMLEYIGKDSTPDDDEQLQFGHEDRAGDIWKVEIQQEKNGNSYVRDAADAKASPDRRGIGGSPVTTNL